MDDSILNSIKGYLGIKDSSYEVFDPDIIMNINSVFATLYQIGVDSAKNAIVRSSEETWNEVFKEDSDLIELIKNYTFMKVRILFDPPSNSSVVSSLEKNIAEIEWRINMQAEGAFNEQE